MLKHNRQILPIPYSSFSDKHNHYKIHMCHKTKCNWRFVINDMSEQICRFHFNKLKDFGVFGRGPQIVCNQVHSAHKWKSLIPAVVYSNMTHEGDKWFDFIFINEFKLK